MQNPSKLTVLRVQNPIFVSSDFTPLSPVEQAGAVVSSREYWKRTAKQFSATD